MPEVDNNQQQQQQVQQQTPPSNQQQVQQQQTPPQQSDSAAWVNSIPEGPARDHIVAKGYKDPAALAIANYNLTRIHTGSGDVIERPKADAKPEEIDKFYRTVNGISDDIKYDLKFPDGVTPDPTYVATAQSWFKDVGLRPDQAQKLTELTEKYSAEVRSKQAAEATAKNEADVAQLKQKYNAQGNGQFDTFIANGQKAARALGLDQSFLDRLDAANGVAANLELLAILGSRIGQEGAFHDGHIDNGAPTPEAARVELAKLNSDKSFTDSLMDPRHAMHQVNMRKRQELQKVAYGSVKK